MRIIQLTLVATLACVGQSTLAQDIDAGAELYRVHCATCHGIEASGQGPMVGVLTIKPANLTALAATNDGVFPVERVVKRIDGRDALISHGSPMPVYGYFFEGQGQAVKTPSGQPILTSAPIVDILAFLQSIQSN